MKTVQKTFVMDSGERYCLLLDGEGMPLYYPNLYLTTQVRGRSLSFSSMESSLSGISVLYRYWDSQDETLENRFSDGRYLKIFELDAIKDFCQLKFGMRTLSMDNVVYLDRKQGLGERVSVETEYARLTVIARYLKWLAEQVSANRPGRFSVLQIGKMEKALKSRRPIKKGRNTEGATKGYSGEQLNLLFEVFRLESELNPFKDKSVRARNRLVFLILHHLGIRGGELLNIRIRDIDFSSNELVIARRADEKDDPRKDQPLVKTLDRRLPMKDTLAKEFHSYVLNERRLVPNSSKHDYLFVTHKAGSTQGQPLSRSAYKKMLRVVQEVSPLLVSFTGHQLRHSWNEAFSQLMDSMDEPPSEEQQEKLRSYLMGWREGSGTSATYNKRYTKRKANMAALTLQKGLIRLPKKVSYED